MYHDNEVYINRRASARDVEKVYKIINYLENRDNTKFKVDFYG